MFRNVIIRMYFISPLPYPNDLKRPTTFDKKHLTCPSGVNYRECDLIVNRKYWCFSYTRVLTLWYYMDLAICISFHAWCYACFIKMAMFTNTNFVLTNFVSLRYIRNFKKALLKGYTVDICII